MKRLLIGDRRVRVRDEGESARPPLVLVHGAGASSVVWLDVVRRLAGRRRVIAPDLPGHGQSDPWHEISLDAYRDAVGTICARLGVGRAVLVGHSLGGAVALRTALAFPDKVAALVLVATGARLKVAPALFEAIAHRFDRFPEVIGKLGYAPSTPREIVERWLAVAVQAPQEIVAGDFRAVDGFDVRERLKELKMPSLVVGAADDLLTPPKLSEELAAGLGNARAVIVPHAGHFLFHERPDAFHAALDPFLDEIPA
jgi:pimeloyl-ACP methyl ester carboxylesterase